MLHDCVEVTAPELVQPVLEQGKAILVQTILFQKSSLHTTGDTGRGPP